LPEDVGADDETMPLSLKRRPVWDRLGKPIVEDRGLVRTHAMNIQNGLDKKAKLMVSEHEQRHCVDSNAQHDIFDKANPRKFTNGHTEVNTGQAYEHVGRANKSRLIGRLSFGGGSVFHGNVDRDNLVEREVHTQKTSLSFPVKSVQSQSMNERNSETEVLAGDQVCSPAVSNTPSSVREDGSSCRNKPVKDVS
jgi:hypothetical protein